MSYSIRLPDGTLVRNIPDDLPPEEAKRRIIAAGLVKAPPPPETTILGQVKEGFKGLVPGAVGLVESAATGASALLPEQYEKAAREKIASIAGAAKAPFAAAEGYEETVGRKLGEAVGSTIPFLAAGPLGLAGRIGAVGLGVGAGAGEARTRAEKEGATAEQRGTATALGVIPGALEAFAPLRILSRIPDAATAQGVQMVKRALVAGGEEAAQEAASGFAQNLIAKGVYKPEQELIEGLGEQAAYGGATGAIVQGLMDLALGRRARGAQPAPGTLPGETPIERAERLAAEVAAAKAAQQPAAPPVPAPAPEPPAPPEEQVPAPPPEGQAPVAPPVGEAPTPPEEQVPVAPPVAEIPAPPPIEEPKVRKPGEPPAGGMQPAEIEELGISKKQPIYRRMLGKDLENPEQRTEVLADIENYLTKGLGSEESRAKLTEFKARFAPPPVVEAATPAVPPVEPVVEAPVGGAPAPTPPAPPVSETPSVATTPTEPEAGGAGAPVAGGPTAVAAPEGAGAVEPTGVVPPVADVGQPAGREEAKPAAVAAAPAPTPAAPAPKPTPVTPEYTEEDIVRAVDTGLLTEEQAEVYRAELREEEAPPTAMGAAFQKQIDDIEAQMNALKKNDRRPAKKTPAGDKYDALKAQLESLQTKETGDLATKLEKMGASGVVGTRGERPIIDLDAVQENLIKARAAPKMYQAVLNYIGVDADGNFLPTTYSREEAAEMAGLGRGSGANVTRVAQSMGITADVVSRFHAGQTDIVVLGKNVSEAGTGATDLQPTRGVLYEAPKKNQPGKAAGFLRDALTSDGKLDFSKVPLNSKKATKDSPAVTGLAEIYARASNYDPGRGGNLEVIKKLNAEIDTRTKTDRRGMQAALDRAYRVVRTEEEAAAEQEGVEPETAAPDQRVSEKEAFEEPEVVDQTRRLSDEDVEYRTIPQSPVVTNRASHAELEKVVTDIGKMLGGKVDVTILDDVTDVDAKQKPGSRAGATIKGGIYLFRSGIAKGIEGQKTVFHELFHKGLKNLLPEAEYRAMMNRFYSQSAEIRAMADAYLASDVGKGDTKNLSPQDARILAVEESLAEVAEQTDLKPTLVRQVGNFLARVADRLGMPQLARAIRTMGLNEQEKFIRDALQAGVGPSKAGEGAARFRAGTSAFKRWFGDSKVVDEKGEPLVVYHGTTKSFNTFVASPEGKAGAGIYLSADPKYANIFGGAGSGKNIMPLYVSMKRPFMLKQSQGVPVEAIAKSFKEFKGADPYSIDSKIPEVLSKYGYDGVVQTGDNGRLVEIVAFRPEQIKSATGNVGAYGQRPVTKEEAERFGMTEAEAAKAQGAGDVRFRSITPQTEAAVQGVDVIGEKERQTLTQRIAQDLKGNPALKLRMKFTDSLAPLEDFFVNAYGGATRTAKGRLNPMVLLSRALDALRVSKAVQEQGGLGFDSGLIVATELKNAEGKPVSYSGVLNRVAEAAKQRGETYETFRTKVDTVLYGHREHGLREKNKTLPKDEQVELLLDDKQIDELEAAFQKDPFIKEVLADLDTIRFNLLDTLVEAKRISKEQAQDYKDATGYIPFNRLGDYEKVYQSTKGANRGVAALRNIRKLEGSTRKTASPIENFSGLVDWATKEAMKNHGSLNALKDMVLMGAAFKRPTKPKTDSPGDMVKVYEDGKEVMYYVPDPAHFIAFSIQDPVIPDSFKLLQRGSQILRAGVTSMPPFAIKQVFDDIVRAYTYAGVKNNAALVKSVMLNFPKNWVNEVFKKKPKDIKNLEALGIVGTFDFSQQGNLENILEGAGAKEESLGSTIMRVMEAGAKASDLAVRQAVYDQVMKETKGDKAQAESAAREIINFSRRGSSKTMNLLISIIPFFNAYARGMDKLATAAAGGVVGQSTGTARAMFYKRMGVLTSMGLVYALMMQDDEEYQNLPDHVRDTNWILPYGKELGFVPAIPIPAELAFFFKAIPERIVRYYKLYGTDEEQTALDVIGNMTKRGLDVFSSPNITAQTLRPFLENIVNHSWFLGRPLESQAQQALRPFERYGTGTSDAMKAVAKGLEDAANATGIEAFAVSPIKLENAIRGIFGTAAGLGLSMADMAINPGRTDRPLHQQLGSQLTGLSAVTKDPIGSRNLDFIYDLEKRVEQVNGTVNRLMERKPEDAEQFIKDNIGLYSIRGAVQGVMEGIRTLNKAAMAVDQDKSVSPEERRKQIDLLRIDQNKLAQQAMMLRKMARDIQMGR
jgi:hypothetical protein